MQTEIKQRENRVVDLVSVEFHDANDTTNSTCRHIEHAFRLANFELQDFLHGSHFGRRERATRGLKMSDDIFDHFAQLSVD